MLVHHGGFSVLVVIIVDKNCTSLPRTGRSKYTSKSGMSCDVCIRLEEFPHGDAAIFTRLSTKRTLSELTRRTVSTPKQLLADCQPWRQQIGGMPRPSSNPTSYCMFFCSQRIFLLRMPLCLGWMLEVEHFYRVDGTQTIVYCARIYVLECARCSDAYHQESVGVRLWGFGVPFPPLLRFSFSINMFHIFASVRGSVTWLRNSSTSSSAVNGQKYIKYI